MLKNFVPGMVIDWYVLKIRSVLGQVSCDTFDVFDIGASFSYLATRDDLEKYAFPSFVQPGHIYQGDKSNYQYKVLAPLMRNEWECEILGLGSVYNIPDSQLRFWKRVDENAYTVPAHGPHICPRCRRGGAQILFKTVFCVNAACPCYVKL